jgi:hypothetical protein
LVNSVTAAVESFCGDVVQHLKPWALLLPEFEKRAPFPRGGNRRHNRHGGSYLLAGESGYSWTIGAGTEVALVGERD